MIQATLRWHRMCHTVCIHAAKVTRLIMSRVRLLALNAADHLMVKKRPDAAASILENYLSAHPACPATLRCLGRVRLEQRRPDLAAPLFRRALALYAEDTTSTLARSKAEMLSST